MLTLIYLYIYNNLVESLFVCVQVNTTSVFFNYKPFMYTQLYICKQTHRFKRSQKKHLTPVCRCICVGRSRHNKHVCKIKTIKLLIE